MLPRAMVVVYSALRSGLGLLPHPSASLPKASPGPCITTHPNVCLGSEACESRSLARRVQGLGLRVEGLALCHLAIDRHEALELQRLPRCRDAVGPALDGREFLLASGA